MALVKMKARVSITAVCCFLFVPLLHAQNEVDTSKIITTLEEALQSPQNVYKLQLRKLPKHQIPDTVFTFANLRWLDVSKNKLKEIPAGIGKLQQLEYLDASKNKLTSVPYTLGFLKNLKVLLLNQNEIETLPKEISNLESLENLDLWSNEIDQFPASISQLHKLKRLDMRVININEPEQQAIKALLPNTEIFFSGGCNCGK